MEQYFFASFPRRTTRVYLSGHARARFSRVRRFSSNLGAAKENEEREREQQSRKIATGCGHESDFSTSRVNTAHSVQKRKEKKIKTDDKTIKSTRPRNQIAMFVRHLKLHNNNASYARSQIALVCSSLRANNLNFQISSPPCAVVEIFYDYRELLYIQRSAYFTSSNTDRGRRAGERKRERNTWGRSRKREKQREIERERGGTR